MDYKTRQAEILNEIEVLESKLNKNRAKLVLLKNMEKPYVANVSAYSGRYSMQYKTEDMARKKLNEYAKKEYFKNGLNYGVYLFKWNEDGSKELLESIPLGNKNFVPNLH
ncbi:hypothetical protein [Bacillus sp. Marseille-P3800]|uniref:hypothetical protein n=1 Tax=Bacillus sp. Marseille-P3800 TaxID=2014782 RepID=UPI000C07FF70|nr:hypothetical protein [Bacillus sp. Marseille-P3800]